MRSVPKKDSDKKLLPFGVQVPKQAGPSSFNLMKQSDDNSQISPEKRFNEENSFYVPKKHLVLPSPLSQTQKLRTHLSATMFGGEAHRGRDSTPKTQQLLSRIGYGLSTGGPYGASSSMLAQERDPMMKKSNDVSFMNKSNLGMLGSSTLKNGNIQLDGNSTKSADIPKITGKESDKLQRLLQYLQNNTQRRMELITKSSQLASSLNTTNQNTQNKSNNQTFTEGTKKKLEHWNQISHMLDAELEERLQSQVDLIGIGEKYAQLNGFAAGLMKSFFQVCSQAIYEADKWKQKCQELEENMATSQMQKLQLQEMLSEKNANLKKFLDVGGVDEVRLKQERRENYITFENSKLAAENFKLTEKLLVLETGADITMLKEQLSKLTKESESKIAWLQKDLESKEREIQKRKLQLTSLQGSLSKIELEARQLRTRVDQQDAELEVLTIENKNNENRANMYRERANMGVEDYEGMLLTTQEQRKLMGTLREKSQALKAKLDRFTIARSKEVEVPSDNTAFVGEESMLKAMIEGDTGKDKTFFRQIAVQVQKQREKHGNQDWEAGSVSAKFAETLDFLALDKDAIKVKIGNDGESQLPLLQVNRASFFVLVETAAKNYELDMQNISSRKILLGFVGNMRAILDSKYNEYILMEGHPRSISRFADFTYAWLGKFTIDAITREIRVLKEVEKATVEDTRINFLMDLQNPKLAGIWEVVVFREFLSEKAASDEVFFYLHCRNLLFKGPSLLRHESTFDIYQYVTLEQADQLFDLILVRFDPVNVMLLKKQLKEKVKLKNDCPLLESGLVLRVLLEFYRIERKNRYKLLKEAFLANSAIGSTGKFCISFQAFKKILFLNFPDASESEVSHLYRDAHALGQGSVTVDMFYAVANDASFFLKYMHLNSYVKAPLLDSHGQLIQTDQGSTDTNSDQDVNMIFRYFYHIMEPLKQLQDQLLVDALQLGVDKIYNEIEEINYQINHKFQQDIPELRGRPFFLQVHRILTLWYTVKSMKAFSYHLLPENQNFGLDANAMILKDFECAPRLISELDIFANKKKIDNLEKNNQLRKLQKMCRQKISKFYSFVSSLLSAKLKASVKDQKNRRRSSLKQTGDSQQQDSPGSSLPRKPPASKPRIS